MSGTLYVVATPIGNLDDASPRALEALRGATRIACEDTRTSQVLFARFGIAAKAVALHEHNEREAAAGLLAVLRQGGDVALISDAGTPALSDPGAHLVAEAHKAGIRVSPVPGPSAAVAAFSAAGFPAGGFLFAGFLPAAAAARRKAIAALALPWPVVLYEAPHRIAATLADLEAAFGPEREVAIARELTKKFEEVARLPLGAAAAWLDGHPHRRQGEFVLVLAAGAKAGADQALAERALEVLLGVMPPSAAASAAARLSGVPKAALYRRALAKAK